MKVKITEHQVVKKSAKVVEVIQSNGSNYNILSITVKKKDPTKILFI